MATFRPSRGLNARVARQFAAPRVLDIAEELERAMKRLAPPGKVWVTAHDERVRQTHVDAEGQLVPGNLRYVLDHPSTTAKELARGPRDPDLSVGNRINCRCVTADIEEAIREAINRGPVEVRGSQASCTVSVVFPRVVESEHPGQGDSGGGWVAAAIRDVVSKRSVRR